MIHFLHTHHPTSTFLNFTNFSIHYYGLIIILGILTSFIIILLITKHQQIKQNIIIDLTFWLIIYGIIGARIYHIFLELPFYLNHPLNIFKIWNGGLAIHGAIIAGIFVIFWFSKKHSLNGTFFWQLLSTIAISMPLAQAIGRWGNYFNQELFGKPTNLPWGIPIDQINKPSQYLNYDYFHPTFLYESIGNLIIFIILLLTYLFLFGKNINNHKLITKNYKLCVLYYAIMYSILRFFLEFLRIDYTPIIFNLRFPQFISLLIFLFAITYLIYLFSPPLFQKQKFKN